MDPFEQPVLLPASMEVAEVRENGTRIDRRDWFIPVVPGQGRPAVELVLVTEELTYTVVLPQDGMAARLLVPGGSSEAIRQPIDLDSLGRDREVW